MDFEVSEADSAQAGLALAAKLALDCVIVDYNLPDSDGVEFIANFRHEARSPGAAIVMVTGQGSEETAVAAMKGGATDYVTKSTIADGLFPQTILNATERARLKAKVTQYRLDLEKSNRSLSEFAHIVSHDMKAPLRRITSYCELIREESGDRLQGTEAEGHVERLMANAIRLQHFIDDLLTFSRVLHAHEDKEFVDITALVRDVMEDLGAIIAETGAQITVAGPLPVIEGYPIRMRQVFQNLIGNAIKYRGRDLPKIAISAQEEGDHYLFRVEDNGMGIAPEYRESIFKAFQRLHSQDKIEGTGLGLSICREVIEMHGGKIWVESELEKGSAFCFTIPLKPGRVSAGDAIGPEPRAGESLM
jgi:light-regulated signal transduction histidine kinase (bacteriophytochrome)